MDDETFSPQMQVESPPSLWRDLPAIWSHCLAGAWLGGYWPGAERWDRLSILLVAASVCYAAGVFLAGRWRRGAPSGWLWTVEWPALLYPVASALSSRQVLAAAVGEGMLVASYVFGTISLARGTPAPGSRQPRWPWLLIVAPVVVNAILSARFGPRNLIVVVLPVFWVARIALGRTVPLHIGRGAALRAGGVLLDLSAVVACTAFLPWLGWFAILFVVALVFERLASTD